MRELKLTLPRGSAEQVFALARDAGIAEASLSEVRMLGRAEPADELKLKGSAPEVKRFLESFLRSPVFDQGRTHLSAHDVLALVNDESAREVTIPTCVPLLDVQHDLWRHCHLTPSLLTRTAVSAGLLTYAALRGDTLLTVGALVFTPFSPLVLAAAFGLASRRPELVRRALRVVAWALCVTVACSALTAAVVRGPMPAEPPVPLGTWLLFSALIGVMAALCDADEVGRRQLLGLAMAYPFVRLVVWFGLAAALGFPSGQETSRRLLALGGNFALMTAAAALTYRRLGRGELSALPR
jgi:hypothetical protein